MLVWVAVVAAFLSLMLSSWAVLMIRRLPDAVVSRLDAQVIEVTMDVPAQPRDGDRFSQPAHHPASDGLTYAQRADRALGREVARRWPGGHVHGV